MAKVTITIEDDPENPDGACIRTEFDPAVEPDAKLTTAQETAFAVQDFLTQCDAAPNPLPMSRMN